MKKNEMNDVFHEYMSKRLNESAFKPNQRSGPVVTISSDSGCYVKKFSQMLVDRLNHKLGHEKWEVISKEILHESAKHMNVDKETVRTVFDMKDRSVLEDVVRAFVSRDYHLERKLLNTVVNVIYSFAVDGYKVIIGRGFNTICANIDNSLHVRIDAPLEWRIQSVMKEKDLSRDKAFSYINHSEANRRNFRKMIRGSSVQGDEFDLIINKSQFTDNEIVDFILEAMKIKKIISNV
jgi:cytidylate kinase